MLGGDSRLPDNEFQDRLSAALADDEGTLIPKPSPEKLRKLGVVFQEEVNNNNNNDNNNNLDAKHSVNEQYENELARARVIENVQDIVAKVAKSFVNRPAHFQSYYVRDAVKNVVKKIYNNPKYYDNIAEINIDELANEFKSSDDFFQTPRGALPGPFHNRYGIGVDMDINRMAENLIPTFRGYYEDFIQQNKGKPGGLVFSK